MEELLNGHYARVRDNMGISREGFLYLEDILVRRSGLRNTRYIDTKEQLGIFLYAVTSDLSIRKLAERFQRSTETIDRTYLKIIRHILKPDFSNLFVQHVSELSSLHSIIEANGRYFLFFKDCVGAIDGTHIPVSPLVLDRAQWRDRDGKLTQNVIAACSFDMRFTDILTGWEGSAADSTL
jgi:hypothetical protein